jgi:hypothetical protein
LPCVRCTAGRPQTPTYSRKFVKSISVMASVHGCEFTAGRLYSMLYSSSHEICCGPERTYKLRGSCWNSRPDSSAHVDTPSITPCSSASAKRRRQRLQCCDSPLSKPDQILTGRVRKTKDIPISQGGFSDIFEGELDGRDGKVTVQFAYSKCNPFTLNTRSPLKFSVGHSYCSRAIRVLGNSLKR